MSHMKYAMLWERSEEVTTLYCKTFEIVTSILLQYVANHIKYSITLDCRNNAFLL